MARAWKPRSVKEWRKFYQNDCLTPGTFPGGATIENRSRAFPLPMPPSLDNYRAVVRGRLITSAQGRAYLEVASELCAIIRMCHKGVEWPMKGPLRVTVTAHFGHPGRADLDNRWKALLDAMQQGGIYENDSQIDWETMVRGDVFAPNGYVKVHIQNLEREDETLLPLPG